jgi:hypothetical protein
MDLKVVSERMYMLNRFLTELSDRNYFWESVEMKIFIKPEVSVSTGLGILPRLTIEQILERIRHDAQINLVINQIEVDEYKKQIAAFKDQIVSNIPSLNTFKLFVEKHCSFVEGYMRCNGYLMDQLYTYENTSLDLYTRQSKEDSLTTSLKIISDIENEQIGNDFCRLPLTIKNPFVMVKFWIKQEVLDFEALIRTIDSKIFSLYPNRH